MGEKDFPGFWKERIAQRNADFAKSSIFLYPYSQKKAAHVSIQGSKSKTHWESIAGAVPIDPFPI
jgi:hypothetical protein